MENRGVPTAVICTDAFTTVAESMAEVQGVPSYKYAVIPHPLASLTEAEIQERAEFLLPQITSLLIAEDFLEGE
jgi:hypothetical protein